MIGTPVTAPDASLPAPGVWLHSRDDGGAWQTYRDDDYAGTAQCWFNDGRAARASATHRNGGHTGTRRPRSCLDCPPQA